MTDDVSIERGVREIYSFLGDLAANNNREWFAANKARYDNVKRYADALASGFIAAVATADTGAGRLSVADCTYRIYRDTRFSADKTPYKTHIGIFVNPPFGKKSITCGYYMHLEPGASMIAAGTACHPADVLKAIRQSIYDNADEYLAIIGSPSFRRLFGSVGDDLLKTAPKGFPKDWEHIDLLRPRNFGAFSKLPDSFFTSPDLMKRLLPYITEGKRYNDFINFTIEDFL